MVDEQAVGDQAVADQGGAEPEGADPLIGEDAGAFYDSLFGEASEEAPGAEDTGEGAADGVGDAAVGAEAGEAAAGADSADVGGAELPAGFVMVKINDKDEPVSDAAAKEMDRLRRTQGKSDSLSAQVDRLTREVERMSQGVPSARAAEGQEAAPVAAPAGEVNPLAFVLPDEVTALEGDLDTGGKMKAAFLAMGQRMQEMMLENVVKPMTGEMSAMRQQLAAQEQHAAPDRVGQVVRQYVAEDTEKGLTALQGEVVASRVGEIMAQIAERHGISILDVANNGATFDMAYQWARSDVEGEVAAAAVAVPAEAGAEVPAEGAVPDVAMAPVPGVVARVPRGAARTTPGGGLPGQGGLRSVGGGLTADQRAFR